MARRSALLLQIPQPCPEAWGAMTPTATGRHCASCEKVVVDFTRMTDGEVVAWFHRNSGQSACGRVSENQLNRPLLPVAHRAPAWHRWALATLLVFGGRAAVATEANAQTAPTAPTAQAARTKAPRSTTPVKLKSLTLRQPEIKSISEVEKPDTLPQQLAYPSRGLVGAIEATQATLLSVAYESLEGFTQQPKQYPQPTKLIYKSLMEGEPLPHPNVR